MKIKSKELIVILLFILVIVNVITLYYKQPYTRHYGKNSITVYQVGHLPNLKAIFIVVTRINNHVIIEIIRGAGVENVDVLKGEEAKRFLKEHTLN